MMNDEQLLRYSRQIMLPDIDCEGQQRLLDSAVLVVGVGGLGSAVAVYLAAAGVGELWLADHDTVDLSNLQRQIAHRSQDVGRLKVASASDTIAALNPGVRLQLLSEKLTGRLLLDAVDNVDLVVDASDNFATRFEVNRACVQLKKPLVSGAAIRMEGQLAVFDSSNAASPCYRCLYDDSSAELELSCADSGILSPLVGAIGSLQAIEAIKLLCRFGQSLVGKLMVMDVGNMEWRTLTVNKASHCPVCGDVDERNL